MDLVTTKYIKHMNHSVNSESWAAIQRVHVYAEQIGIEIPLFKGVTVLGHPNPMLELDRPALPRGNLGAHKRACKQRTQRALELAVDADTILVGFVGRLTYEKGADLVMHAAFWLLAHEPRV